MNALPEKTYEQRLHELLAEVNVPEPVKSRFIQIVLDRQPADIVSMVDILTEDPTVAEFFIEDLALKQRLRDTKDSSVITEIIRNQDRLFEHFEQTHHD